MLRISVFSVLIAVILVSHQSLAAFPQATNNLVDSLSQCASKAQSDYECISHARNALQRASSYIQKVRQLKNAMQAIWTGFNTLKTSAKIAKYIPAVGTGLNALLITLDTSVKPPFKRGLEQIKKVDQRLYPYKARCDKGAGACYMVSTALKLIKTRCSDGHRAVENAKQCVERMPANDALRGALGSSLETLSAGVTAQTLSDINNCSVCDAITPAINIALSWPNLDDIIEKIRGLKDFLDPILDILDKIQKALDKEFCLFVPSWGKREVESLAISKRDNVCYSVQELIDGVDRFFAVLVNKAREVLDELLSLLPSFTLPGLPDFGNLFNIDLNFDLPDINFGFNMTAYLGVALTVWDCAIQTNDVCTAGTGAVTANCENPMVNLRIHLGK